MHGRITMKSESWLKVQSHLHEKQLHQHERKRHFTISAPCDSHIPSSRREVVRIEEPASSVSRSPRLRPTLDASDLLPSQSFQQLTQRPPSEEPYPDKEKTWSPFPPLQVEESFRCITTRTSPRTVNLRKHPPFRPYDAQSQYEELFGGNHTSNVWFQRILLTFFKHRERYGQKRMELVQAIDQRMRSMKNR